MADTWPVGDPMEDGNGGGIWESLGGFFGGGDPGTLAGGGVGSGWPASIIPDVMGNATGVPGIGALITQGVANSLPGAGSLYTYGAGGFDLTAQGKLWALGAVAVVALLLLSGGGSGRRR